MADAASVGSDAGSIRHVRMLAAFATFGCWQHPPRTGTSPTHRDSVQDDFFAAALVHIRLDATLSARYPFHPARPSETSVSAHRQFYLVWSPARQPTS